jgi:hypothetical protein
MFVSSSEHKYDKSLQQLGALLHSLVNDDKLECVGSAYSLRKKEG